MLLVVEDGLIEVADAPAQGDVVVEQLRKFGGSLTRVRVTPRAEGHQDFLLLVERHIAVHHCREADGGQRLYLAVVLALYVLAQLCITVLQAIPDGFCGVRPEAVYELVLPLVASLCNGFVVLVDEYGLDTCGTEFDSQDCFSSLDCLLCSHCFLFKFLEFWTANIAYYFDMAKIFILFMTIKKMEKRRQVHILLVKIL